MKDLEDWAAVQADKIQAGNCKNPEHLKEHRKEAVGHDRTSGLSPDRDYSSKLNEYKELIIKWRCDPYNFNGTLIFRELKEKGYTGSIGSILLDNQHVHGCTVFLLILLDVIAELRIH